MKLVSKIGAQGECLFIRIDRLPKNAVETVRDAGAPIIVGHSETGHHHVVDNVHVRHYHLPSDPSRVFLTVPVGEVADVTHLRPWDTHETLRLLNETEGTVVWEVPRQREWAPEGWKPVID